MEGVGTGEVDGPPCFCEQVGLCDEMLAHAVFEEIRVAMREPRGDPEKCLHRQVLLTGKWGYSSC